MYIKVNSTRDTMLGTFRFGCVYKVDEKDYHVKKTLKPLMDGDKPAIERVTAKAVRAQKLKYLDMTGPANDGTEQPVDETDDSEDEGGE